MSHQQVDNLKWWPSLFAVFCQLAFTGCFFPRFFLHWSAIATCGLTRTRTYSYHPISWSILAMSLSRFCVTLVSMTLTGHFEKKNHKIWWFSSLQSVLVLLMARSLGASRRFQLHPWKHQVLGPGQCQRHAFLRNGGGPLKRGSWWNGLWFMMWFR